MIDFSLRLLPWANRSVLPGPMSRIPAALWSPLVLFLFFSQADFRCLSGQKDEGGNLAVFRCSSSPVAELPPRSRDSV